MPSSAKTFKWVLRIKASVLTDGLGALHHLSLCIALFSLASSPTTLHLTAATLASLLFLQTLLACFHLGARHWQLPLFTVLFPRVTPWFLNSPPWGFVHMSSLEGFPNTPVLSRYLLHLTSTLFLAFSPDHMAPYDILCLLPQIVNAMREGSFVYFVPCCILSGYFNSSWHIVDIQ